MSNKRITDLTELTTPTTDDVFPVVDIATNTTTKVQLANLPVQTAVTTALATKQATLVSGTNIKTVNSTTLLGSGDIAVQPTLVSGTSIKTVNSNSLLGSGDVAVQATLVSGVSIKTVNSTSLLGSGDIPIPIVTPSGVAGAIQFSNGSAFASDAANLFWDDTNNRLGVGTNAPTRQVELVGSVASPAYLALRYGTATGSGPVLALDAGSAGLNYQIISTTNSNGSVGANGLGIYDGTDYRVVLKSGNLGIGEVTPTARLQIKGSGSTSATTSLLVQNSGGTDLLRVRDDGQTIARTFTQNAGDFSTIISGTNFSIYTAGGTIQYNGNSQFNNNLLVLGQLSMSSTTQGFLPPRMTTTQKNAIASPAAGLVVYDSTTNKLQCYNGSTWNDLF